MDELLVVEVNQWAHFNTGKNVRKLGKTLIDDGGVLF